MGLQDAAATSRWLSADMTEDYTQSHLFASVRDSSRCQGRQRLNLAEQLADQATAARGRAINDQVSKRGTESSNKKY